ncbi:DsbA family protein [Paenibacillus glycinis]|uniref:DSBA-like thioredoxin domain-containing protein n=1 Tax=Paenibacillus glycinis TaxID=2697035 RepID=A0ABW9XRQ3_9BACL|nr:DsbA family protein [Paenibacillus glycinis]NBD25034.1 hypothetical protein [Paenibacillus glycinis]
MKVDIISDIACPWCYVAKTRFWRALREFPGAERVEVDYVPFQLNPMMPMAAMWQIWKRWSD